MKFRFIFHNYMFLLKFFTIDHILMTVVVLAVRRIYNVKHGAKPDEKVNMTTITEKHKKEKNCRSES